MASGCLTVAVVFAFALAGGASAQTVGGTAIVAVDQEPPCLNPYLASCNLGVVTRVAGLALAGAYRVLPDFSYEPALVASVDVQRSPFALTYHIKPEAEWSDGVPVSADDLIFTREAIMDPANQIATRVGYDRIVQAIAVDPKTARFVFSRPFAPWKTLFPFVLPKHALEGEDFDTVWSTIGTGITDPNSGQPIASGPFLVTNWATGVQLELSRNPNWWGPHLPYLDGIVFRVILIPADRIQAITSGAVHVIDAAFVTAELAALYGAPGIVAAWNPGSFFEHLDFSTSSAAKPLLRERWFREAVAYSIDRAATVSTALGLLSPGLGPHQSLMYLSQQSEYRQHFARYQYNPGTVASIMGSHGCTLGGDGIWSCGGTRASLRFATTTGNAFRAQLQGLLLAQAQTAGIELVPDNSSPAVLFGTRLPARDFDLVMFAWLRNGDPFGLEGTYGCGGGSNFTDYCSPAATQFLTTSNDELSPSYRAGLVNRADSILAGAVASIPLVQRPAFLAHLTTLHGVVASVGPLGPSWNAENWWIE